MTSQVVTRLLLVVLVGFTSITAFGRTPPDLSADTTASSADGLDSPFGVNFINSVIGSVDVVPINIATSVPYYFS